MAAVAIDSFEMPKIGVRSQEWTGIGATDVDVLVETASCLREISAGRAPQ